MLAAVLFLPLSFVPAWQLLQNRGVAPVVAQPPQPAPRSLPVRADLPNIDGTGAFRSVQEYPCDLDIKVIGNNEGPFVSDIRTLCAELTGQQEEDVPVRWRDNGKYRSITLTLHFENADQASTRALKTQSRRTPPCRHGAACVPTSAAQRPIAPPHSPRAGVRRVRRHRPRPARPLQDLRAWCTYLDAMGAAPAGRRLSGCIFVCSFFGGRQAGAGCAAVAERGCRILSAPRPTDTVRAFGFLALSSVTTPRRHFFMRAQAVSSDLAPVQSNVK
jgi:putative lipoic acid-binding regulatory protein